MNTSTHWDEVYSTKAANEVSWFQRYPTSSMELIALFNLPLDANIIDIGGGDSYFVDALLDRGYKNIYVLDISPIAIERAKHRLGTQADKVHWIVSDVTTFEPTVKYDFWHDRAAFHFLTTEKQISQYIRNAENAIKENGHLILGTFSEKGPQKCSGLAIKQYSATSMSLRFEVAFNRIKCIEEEHTTPNKNTQHFLFCSFIKKKSK